MINKIESCLSDKEKATLPDTLHGLEYENASEFNKVLLSFLNKH
jgi:hypothetical protein